MACCLDVLVVVVVVVVVLAIRVVFNANTCSKASGTAGYACSNNR